VTTRGRSTKTGRSYLDAIASVLGYAADLGIVEASPVAAFREALHRRTRTKRGRSESEAGRHVRPIEGGHELARLVSAAQEEGREPEVLVLLDAGLRLGEALGLTWGSIGWGESGHASSRSLFISGNRPRGGAPSLPKSGRTRRVALSQRLRRSLLDLYQSRLPRARIDSCWRGWSPPTSVATSGGASAPRRASATGR
jgi:integrase